MSSYLLGLIQGLAAVARPVVVVASTTPVLRTAQVDLREDKNEISSWIFRSEQRELTVPLPEALMAGFVHTKLPTLLLMLELPGFLTPCREEMGVSQIESLVLFSDCT